MHCTTKQIKIISFLKQKPIRFKNQKCSMKTTTQASTTTILDKKLDHYRNLDALDNKDELPSDWHNAKPFEELPGPQPLPLIGNIWRFAIPKIGDYFGLDYAEIFEKLHHQYGDITVLKGFPGRHPMVILYDPKDVEKMHRSAGIWPHRNAFHSFNYYREAKKDVIPRGGLVNINGEEWFKFRTLINPILMQPKNVFQYTEKMDYVASELVDNIKFFCESNQKGELPENFHTELYKWSLESIGVITMDTHLGCLQRGTNNEETQKLIQSVLDMFDLFYKLDVLPSTWKYVSTPSWRKFIKVMDYITETNLKYINKHMDTLKGQTPEQVTSILQQMVQTDKNVALTMSLDMMMAGVDTTARVLGATLYFLSKNQKKQDMLRVEALKLLPKKDSPVTEEVLKKAAYNRTVIKESTRLAPITIGNSRMMTRPVVLGGYQIPPNVDVISANLLLCKKEQHFPRPKEFLPERWLKSDEEISSRNTHPFVFAPFGHGQRSCVGKRLANLELETAILKIVRNFKLDWPHDDVVFSTKALHGISSPLKLHVKNLDV